MESEDGVTIVTYQMSYVILIQMVLFFFKALGLIQVLCMDMTGVLQKAGDADSRTHTRSQM